MLTVLEIFGAKLNKIDERGKVKYLHSYVVLLVANSATISCVYTDTIENVKTMMPMLPFKKQM